MRTAVLKTIFLAAVLCGLVLPPAQAEIRILGSAGGQVGPFLDLFERVRASGERVVIDGPCLSLGTMVSPSVQADRHGPSMTTRSPEARTRSNRSRNGPTCPPGLARMRISACAGGEIRLPSAAASRIILAKAVRISRTSLRSDDNQLGNGEPCHKVSP